MAYYLCMNRIAILLLLACAVQAEPRSYEIRPADGTRMELRVYKTGFMRGKVHLFQFPQYKGTLLYDPRKPEASEVTLTIPAASIQLLDTWLSAKDFKSVQQYALKDMLAAERFPEITFSSMAARPLENGVFEVRGTLAIRGVPKPAVVKVTPQTDSGADPRFKGEARIRLTDYGLKPPTAGFGTVGTKDEMDFTFTLTAALKPPREPEGPPAGPR